ncbi:Ger(x)C family spore germination protein [Falsibacillus albus]|nr:Ger(x)C family spore germination protein [Falsibacillus albus]
MEKGRCSKVTSKIALLLGLIISSWVLSGCADRLEIEEEGFVIVIGLDAPSVGKRGFDVTYQIANPVAGPKSDDIKEEKTITLTAPDAISGRDLVNASETRNINFYHTKAIVVSEELARSRHFFEIISSLMRDRQIRRDMYLIVSKEKASDYLRNNASAFESSPHKFYDYMSRRWETNAMSPRSTLHTFIHDTQADAGLSLAIYTTAKQEAPKEDPNEDDFYPGQINKQGGTQVQIIGSAVFKNGKMIGALTGEETRLTAVLRDDKKPRKIFFTFPDPLDDHFRITGRAKNIQTVVKANIDGTAPRILVEEWMDIGIVYIPSMVNYVENLQKQKVLKKSLEKNLEQQSEKLIEKTQNEYKAEPFYWSVTARKEFVTIDDYVKYNWMKSYPNANIKVKYHVKLDSFGKQLRPEKLEKIKD